ncbi:hypothetical protein FO519_009941 [Halicephalobus sp. NKZ332]|nr:hypothetical protein FO519_009941 [Halicephalobus sp. NKZ332]
MGIIGCPEIIPPAPAALLHGFAIELVEIFGQGFCRFLFAMILWGGADVIQLQTYCLMYRYCAIHPNPKLLQMFMSWPGLIIFHIIGYTITFSLSIPGYLSIADAKRTNELLASVPPEILVNRGPRTPIFVLDVNYPIVFGAVLYICFLLLVSIILGFYMAVHIILYLRKHASNFTERTYKMHLQLTVVLIVQQITPIIFMVIPVATVILIAVMNGGNVYISKTAINIIMLMLTFYPMTNALICVIFITPYWNFTKQWCLWILYRLHIIKIQQIEGQKLAIMNSKISSMTYAG